MGRPLRSLHSTALLLLVATACANPPGAVEHGGGRLGPDDPAEQCAAEAPQPTAQVACFPNSGATRCRNYISGDWYVWRFTDLAEPACMSPDFLEFDSEQACRDAVADLLAEPANVPHDNLVCLPNQGHTRCRNYISGDWYLWRFTDLSDPQCVQPDFFEFPDEQACRDEVVRLTAGPPALPQTSLVCFPNQGHTRCRNYISGDWYLWRFTDLGEPECVQPDFFEFPDRAACEAQVAALTGV